MDNQSTIYNSDHLKMLSRVLEEALEATVNGTRLTESAAQELKPRLGKVIMDSFVAGETDPAVLKKIAVESLQQR